MSAFRRIWDFSRANPVTLYLAGGIVLHVLRTVSVNAAYNQNFARFDVER